MNWLKNDNYNKDHFLPSHHSINLYMIVFVEFIIKDPENVKGCKTCNKMLRR